MQCNKWNIGWGVVSLCNMNCQFCYSRMKRKDEKDLLYKDWIRFVDENHNKINSINYGTGENSLSDDWFKLIEYIRKNYSHIRQAVTTNGYIGKAMKESPEKYRIVSDAIDEFDISLDYSDMEKHNIFRGQRNAGEWVLDTLKYCKESKKEGTIVCLASKPNMYMDNVDGLFEIAAKYDTKIRMNIYRPTEGINDFTKQFILEAENLVDILYKIDEKYKVLAISDALFSNLLTDKNEEDHSGIDSIRILPDGNITPSTYLIDNQYIVGNIKEKNILEKLDNSKLLQRTIHKVIPKECENCVYKNKCKGGVVDRRYLWYGSLEHKDPYCVFNQKELRKISISERKFQSVHYGYLPTMFFSYN